MRKEVGIAILVGFVFGLIITFGIWTANKTLKQKDAETPATTEEINPTPTIATAAENSPSTLSLSINSPEDQSIVSGLKITVNGKTEPGAIVVIISEKSENIIEAGADGFFESPLTLDSGTNEITITAFGANGAEATKTISIVQSTAEI